MTTHLDPEPHCSPPVGLQPLPVVQGSVNKVCIALFNEFDALVTFLNWLIFTEGGKIHLTAEQESPASLKQFYKGMEFFYDSASSSLNFMDEVVDCMYALLSAWNRYGRRWGVTNSGINKPGVGLHPPCDLLINPAFYSLIYKVQISSAEIIVV